MKRYYLIFKKPRTITLVVACFCVFSVCFGQKNTPSFDAYFGRSDNFHELGKYKNALRVAKNAEKKIPSTSNEPIGKVWGATQKAKIYEAQGLYSMMSNELDSVQKDVFKLKETQPIAYATTLLRVADTYNAYGNPLKATSVLEGLKDIEEKLTPLQKSELQYQRTLIDYQSGNFVSAAGNAKILIDIRKKQLSTKMAGEESPQKISRPEQKAIRKQLANLYTLEGQILTKSGFYERADSLLLATRILVRKTTNVTSPYYMNHLIAIAENYDQQGKYSKAIKYYVEPQRAPDYYNGTFQRSSKLFYRLQEGVYRNSVLSEKIALVQFIERLQLKQLTKKYFKKESIYTFRFEMIDIEELFAKKRYPEAQKRLEEFLQKPQLPEDHELRVRAMQMLSQIYTRDNVDFLTMDKTHRGLFAIQAKRFPKESFEFKLAEVRFGSYLAQYTDNFQEAKGIFEAVPFTVVESHLSPTHKDFIAISNEYAQYYQSNDNFKTSYEILKNTAAIIEKKLGNQDPRLAEQLLRVADANAMMGDYRNAEKNANQALDLLKRRYSLNDSTKANLSKKELKNNQKASLSPLYAEALGKVARIYGIIGDYPQAERMLRSSNAIYIKIDSVQKAEKILALKTSKKKKKEEDGEEQIAYDLEALKAESVEDLASLYVRIGDFSNTEKLLAEAISNKESKYGKTSKKLIKPLNQLANFLIIKGEYSQSARIIERTEQISAKVYGKESLAYAEGRELEAKLRANLGDYENAQKELEEVITIETKVLGKDHIRNAESLTQMGLIELGSNPSKNAKNVEQKFNDAKNIIEKTFDNQHPQYAEALKNLALLYVQTQRPSEALTLLDEANTIWTKKIGENNINAAKVYALKADAYVKLKNYTEAEKNYQNAKELYAKFFDRKNENYIKTLGKLGRVHYTLNDYTKANDELGEAIDGYLVYIRKNFPVLSERGKSKYWTLIQGDFEFYKTLAVKQMNTKPELLGNLYNQTLATKALLLSASVKVRAKILNSGNASLIQDYQEWVAKKEFLAAVLSMSNEDKKQNGINQALLEQQIETIEKRLNASSELFSGDVEIKNYTWQDVKAKLKPSESALEVIKFRYYDKDFTDSTLYVVLRVSPEATMPEAVVLANGNEMDRDLLAYYRNTIKFNKANKYNYINFWKPIEPLVKDSKKIYFSPDGAYNQINLETIQSEQGYLLDQYNIVLVSNTKDLLIAQKPKNTEKFIQMYGNPNFYSTDIKSRKVSDLPGTAQEISDLKALFLKSNWKVSDYTQNEAEEASLKSNTSSPTILHIATHGFFIPDVAQTDATEELAEVSAKANPLLRSGVLFRNAGDILEDGNGFVNSKDGILTPYETMNLNFDNTDLVVLSACETGLGDIQVGEGVLGLQRAFLVAGASGVVMSLFKVSDEVTVKLMVAFYTNFLNGDSKRDAFRKAKQTIKEAYPNPLYWGAFVMIGGE